MTLGHILVVAFATRTVGVAVAVLGLLAVIGTTNRGLRHETDEDAQPQPG